MKQILKKILIGILVLLVAITAGFFIYTSNYYRADEVAINLLNNNPSVHVKSNHLVVSPDEPSDTALIFYPGAKVEYFAYLPLLEQITQRSGITSILVKMPFNLAIFNSDAAHDIMSDYPEIKHWLIGGHSLGGAMASDFASKNPDAVEGLILMGAYIYGSYPDEDALTIYGTLNTNVPEHIDYTENIVVIEGGNHAQFGNYGPQRGDPPATISAAQQQALTVEAVDAFLKERKVRP